METININQDTKNEFEKERFQMRLKENKLVSQDDFLELLIINWKSKKMEEIKNGKKNI